MTHLLEITVTMSNSLPRITARVDEDTQLLLSEAAAIMGISSINSFVLSSAIEKAKEIMLRERVLKLSQRDAVLLIDSLDSPTKANKRLQRAFKNYNTKLNNT